MKIAFWLILLIANSGFAWLGEKESTLSAFSAGISFVFLFISVAETIE